MRKNAMGEVVVYPQRTRVRMAVAPTRTTATAYESVLDRNGCVIQFARMRRSITVKKYDSPSKSDILTKVSQRGFDPDIAAYFAINRHRTDSSHADRHRAGQI